MQREVLDVLLHLFALGLTHAHAELTSSPSFRYQTYPRLVSTSRVKKNTCGGVKAAIDPFLPPPATRTRFFALTVTRVSFFRPPNSYFCGSPPRSRQVTRRSQSCREPFQSRFILVGDRLLVGFRDRFHAKQVRAAIGREAQASREDSHRQSREIDLDSRAVGLNAARIRFERRIRACGSPRVCAEARTRGRWVREVQFLAWPRARFAMLVLVVRVLAPDRLRALLLHRVLVRAARARRRESRTAHPRTRTICSSRSPRA